MSSVSAVNSLLSTTPTSVNISSILAAAVGATTPGIDVTSAVAAALYADRASERGWQAQQAALATQTTALTSIQTATTALTTDMSALNTLTGPLAARIVTSSDTSTVTATAAEGTVAGTHSIVVNNLASTASWYSDLEPGTGGATAALTPSTFTITNAAGTSFNFPTGSATGTEGDNLTDLAATINSKTTLGVTASVVSDSTGSRLAIVSNASGSAANFTVTTPYTGTAWTSTEIPTGDTLGANNLTISSGTGSSLATLNVATTSGETYAQLSTAINSAVAAYNTAANAAVPPTANLNVHATTTSSATGTSLVINSSDTAQTPFTINEPSVNTPSFGFAQSSVGENSSLTVDGVPISTATNTVTGAISGVTLSLVGVNPAATSLTVASDASQVSTAVNQFVSDYNSALSLVNAQFTASAAGTQGVLSGDSTIRDLQSSLLQVLNYVNTPATGTTTVPDLSAMGITAGTDGTLSVDSSTLDSALTNNPTDVQNFFQGASLNGFANNLNNQLANFTNPGNGAFTVDLGGISKTSASLTTQVSNYESIYIAAQQTSLTAMYSQAEIALQQLPTEMAQIQAELGNNTKSGG